MPNIEAPVSPISAHLKISVKERLIMKNMKIFRRWLSLILSVALLVSAVPSIFASAAADGQDTTVLFDGTYMGWFTGTDNNSYTVRLATPGILVGKDVLRITAQGYKDGWNELYLDSKTLSENGISDTSSLKTISFFVKTDKNMNALKLKLSDVMNDRDPYEAKLSTGKYYLLDTESSYITTAMLDNGHIIIPSGFTGYVVYDLESCNSDEVTALMNLDFGSMRLWFPSASENELDTSWYFGELAVSEKDAGTFMADYSAASAVSYRIHSGNKVGWVFDSNKQTAEAGVEGILDGQKVVKLTFKDFGWLQHYTDGLSLTDAGIAAGDVQAISVFIKADEKYDQNIRFGGYNESGENAWAEFNYINSPVILYDINSGVVSTLTSNGSGCVTVPAGFTGYMIYDLRNGKADATAVENLLTKNDGLSPLRFGAVFDKEEEDQTFEEQTFYYGDMRVWTAGDASRIIEIFAEESGSNAISYRIHSGDKVGWVFDAPDRQSAETSVEGILDGQKVVRLTFKAGDFVPDADEWRDSYTDGLSLKDAGIAADDVKAMSVFIMVDDKSDMEVRFGGYIESGENAWKDFVYKNSPVILYDIKSGEVWTVTSKENGLATVPAGFTGYMIYDFRNEKADAQAVEDILKKNDGLSPLKFSTKFAETVPEDLTFCYGDMRVWTTGDGMSAAVDLGADSEFAEYDGVTVLDMESIGSYNYTGYGSPPVFNTEIVDGVSPDGATLKLTEAGNTSTYPFGWHDLSAVNNLSEMKALSFWVKAPDGLTDVQFTFFGEGHGFKGTITTVNTATGEIDVKYDKYSLSLPVGFEGYVILNLETALFQHSWGDYTDTWQTIVGENKNCSVGFSYNAENIRGGVLYLDSFTYHTDAAAAVETLSSASVAGDVNNDGVTDILDLVRAKKYLAGSEESTINYFNAKFTYELGYSSADLTALRKLLMGQETAQPEGVYVPASLNKTGTAIYHMTVDEWNYSESDIGEELFINNYATYDSVDLKAIKAKGGVSWLQLSTPAFAYGSTEIPESWKTRIETIIETYKRQGVYNTMAGFIFEECLWSMTVEQHIAVTKYLRETYPDKRVFDVLQYSDISSDKITPESFQYVTDIAYDWYHSTDAEAQQTLLSNMLEKAGNRADLRVWFFPLACELRPSEPYGAEYDLAHINMCYDMLKSLPEEQQGGLVFYNWLSFAEEDGQQISIGLEDLISEPEYADVINRMVEISKEILNK